MSVNCYFLLLPVHSHFHTLISYQYLSVIQTSVLLAILHGRLQIPVLPPVHPAYRMQSQEFWRSVSDRLFLPLFLLHMSYLTHKIPNRMETNPYLLRGLLYFPPDNPGILPPSVQGSYHIRYPYLPLRSSEYRIHHHSS